MGWRPQQTRSAIRIPIRRRTTKLCRLGLLRVALGLLRVLLRLALGALRFPLRLARFALGLLLRAGLGRLFLRLLARLARLLADRFFLLLRLGLGEARQGKTEHGGDQDGNQTAHTYFLWGLGDRRASTGSVVDPSPLRGARPVPSSAVLAPLHPLPPPPLATTPSHL